ncbi:MAG: hypothetical protein KA149_07935 [Chitinophagales bacterium]|nr:hypothetical protein [Chitinophagales bacterium]
MQKTVRYIFVVSLMLLLFLPVIQFWFGIPKIENTWLAGMTEDVKPEKLNRYNWLNETFQKSADGYLQQRAGYKPWLVKLTNEWKFRLFNDAPSDLVVGKNNCLFASPYINSFTGQDITDNGALLRRVKRSAYMQHLFDSIGKPCLFIIAPGKASYMSEYIPAAYMQKAKGENNYKLLQKDFEAEGVKHIDFYSYFLKQKSKTDYPLFTMQGVHWSLYGGFCAADSIVGFMNYKSGKAQKSYYVKNIEVSNKPRGTDKDLQDLMNIFSEVPGPELAYPQIALRDSFDKAEKPRLLVIGDSYMWTLYQCGVLPASTSQNSAYWYYANTVYDFNISPTGKEIKNLNIQQQLKDFDVVLFVFTETDMANYDFGMSEIFIQALEKEINERN